MKKITLNADGHDESQWLPRKWTNPKTGKEEDYPVINAHRVSKGDIRYDGVAIKARQWLPDILFDRSDERQKPYNDTCVSFFGYYVSAMQALGISDIRNILFDVVEQAERLPPVDTYSAILRGIPKPESNALLWVVLDERNRGNIALAHKMLGTIRHAIDNTAKVIDKLVEVRKMAASNAISHVQNLPASERVF